MIYLNTNIAVDENTTQIVLCSNEKTHHNFHIQYQFSLDRQLREYWDKGIDINSSVIENAVLKMNYGGCGRQSTLELREKYNFVRKVAFPSMTLIFYSLLFLLGRIPSFEEFRNLFFNQVDFFELHGDTILCKYKNQNISFDYYSAETRLWIAYPAFIRDLHFACLLNESDKCDKVRISTSSDASDKIDVMYWVFNDAERFAVDLKNNMREEFVSKDIFKHGKLIIDMGDSRIKDKVRSQFGDYYLFNNNAIDFAIKYNRHELIG